MAARVTSSCALGLYAVAVLLVLPSGAQAQAQAAAGSHVVAIRATEGVSDADAQRLDSLLLGEVARTSGLAAPELAALELSEIELAVGCADTAAACLRAIAGTVGAESLLVRRLRRTPAGLTLTLTWFDASSDDAPRTIESQAPDAERLAEALPHAVRQLFGAPEPVIAAVASGDGVGVARGPGVQRVSADGSGAGVPFAPLLIGAVGAATLGVGVVFGLLSAGAADRYTNTSIRTASDADAALAALDEARSRALVANVLYGTGGTLLLVGVTWLVIELATGRTELDAHEHFSALGRSRASARRTSLGMVALQGGALFSFEGSL